MHNIYAKDESIFYTHRCTVFKSNHCVKRMKFWCICFERLAFVMSGLVWCPFQLSNHMSYNKSEGNALYICMHTYACICICIYTCMYITMSIFTATERGWSNAKTLSFYEAWSPIAFIEQQWAVRHMLPRYQKSLETLWKMKSRSISIS